MWRNSLLVCVVVAACALARMANAATALDDPSALAMTPHARVALVIGNGEVSGSPLPNARRDALAMADALRTEGYTVTLALDSSARQMHDLLAHYAMQLDEGARGVLYFSGHGVMVDGEPALIPADSGKPAARAVNLHQVIERPVKAKATQRSLIILDMCLADVHGAAALHKDAVHKQSSALIALATAAGERASDDASYGVFTHAWLDALKRPHGGDIGALFPQVQRQVESVTAAYQRPQLVGSPPSRLIASQNEVALAGSANLANSDSAHAVVAWDTRGILPKDSNEQYEITFWDSIKDSTYASDYEAYLKAYPSGRFAPLAKARIERLKTAAPATAAPASPSKAAPAAPVVTQSAPAPAPVPERPRPAPIAPAVTQAPPHTPAAAAAPTDKPRTAVANNGEAKDCANCPVMIALPAGAFAMGSATDDPSEKPVHKVTIGAPFAIGKYEVTVEQWNACADANACPRLSPENNASRRAPARDLSWDDAQLYVKWLSKTTGKPYRLPTEAEWEYAARGGTTSAYWWGEQMRKGMANCKDCGDPWHKEGPEDTGSFAANPYGLYDMNGSVWEWVGDCWHSSYQGAPNDGHAWDAPGCDMRVIRGGSWREGGSYMLSSTRFKYSASVRQSQDGFRVLKELK